MDKKQVILKHLARNARLLLMAFIITGLALTAQPAAPVMAQSAQDGFDPGADDRVNTIVVQPDGKILVGGDFTELGGQPRQHLSRLHPDGTLDQAFNPGAYGESLFSSGINTILVQPDGKILVGGRFTEIGGQTRQYLARLHPDGTLDQDYDPGANGSVTALALQPDGKILVGGGFSGQRITRLHPDGTLDQDFDNPDLGPYGLHVIALQPDGKILVGGLYTFRRLYPDGSLDTAFDPEIRLSHKGQLYVSALAVQPDGMILVGGEFDYIDNEYRTCIARLHPDGSLDQDFDPRAGSSVRSFALQPDGKILIGGSFNRVGGQDRLRIARLHPDGALDLDFDPGANGSVRALALQPDGNILVGGWFTELGGQPRQHIARLYPYGSLDQDFETGADSWVNAISVQPDGRILVGGVFTKVAGEPHQRIARLYPNSAIDQDFNPEADADVTVLTPQPDGMILVGGNFTELNDQPRERIARLHPDGALDLDFDPGASDAIRVITLQPDDKILVGGSFNVLGDQPRERIARLLPNGSLDQDFDTGANSTVHVLALQPDGMILVGGAFTEVHGQPRHHIARLHSNGDLDQDFNPDVYGDSEYTCVKAILVQPNGKILVGGRFTEVDGQHRQHIARLHPNGILDQDFNPGANNKIRALALQLDGKILVGGDFTELGGELRHRIARLHPNSALDQDFNPEASSLVFAIALQPDGKVLLGGWFQVLGGQPRYRIGRLSNNTAAFQHLAVSASRDRITWMRGGSGPEVWRVTFETSSDGQTYTQLGEGTRIPGGWALDGLNLPVGSSFIRARGYYTTGLHNGGGSIVESVRLVFLTQAPAITSEASTAFTVGTSSSFTVTAAGYPAPELTISGALPSGVTFTNNEDGTATLAGTPAPGSVGTYKLTITASNGVGADAVQAFTLSVNQVPAITSGASTAFAVGTPGSFAVMTTGHPTPGLAFSGALPDGVTFTDNGNGTATLAGTPAAGSGGVYNLTITASNGVGADAEQAFTLTINESPNITSVSSTTFTVGTSGLFTVTAAGHPAPALKISGALPDGVTFTDNENDTATLAGAPAAGSGGVYDLTITASNGVGADAEQAFTLTVEAAKPEGFRFFLPLVVR